MGFVSSDALLDLSFQQKLLERVSRSFAFTIPELPSPLCKIVANAYLLLRIADTIEDEKALTLDQKQFFWDELIGAISERGIPETLTSDLPHLLSPATSPDERELIKNSSRIIFITRSFNENEREVLKRCLKVVCKGMMKFQRDRNPKGLRNLAELNDYCYYVAGVVGEFLTDLFCNYSVEISKKRLVLRKLAVSFGQGLQITNILKDLWKDLDQGVCWLPGDLFKREGFALEDISRGNDSKGFKKGISELVAIAHSHLKNALTYTLLIPRSETGIRKFCLWSIGLALFTLRKISKKTYLNKSEDLKISRRSVRVITLTTCLILKSNFLLKLFFFLSSMGLPRYCLSNIKFYREDSAQQKSIS